MTTSNQDKKHLRRLGHNLKPWSRCRQRPYGVSAEIDRALNDHELIKIKLVTEDRDDKQALTDTICKITVPS